MKYRWMQKQDFNKVLTLSKKKNLKNLLKNHKTIANVVEIENDVVGFIIYNINKNNIEIISIYYDNENVFNFIIEKITNKFAIPIVIDVSEYNLNLHLLLKNKNFLAKSINKINDTDHYRFELGVL